MIIVKNTIVRIKGVEITNFKNVNFGHLDFKTSKNKNNASILGLYGQNGSGKTALIDALELLKLLLCGKQVPSYFADYINVDSEYATLKYELEVSNTQDESTYSAFYSVNLCRELKSSEQNVEQPLAEESYKPIISNEKISYSYMDKESSIKMSPVINTGDVENVPFSPKSKRLALVGNNRKTLTNLLVSKQLAYETSRSFVFSREMLTAIKENCKENRHSFLLSSLVHFGNFQLFVINTKNVGLISLNVLPISFSINGNRRTDIGDILIELNKSSLIPESAFEVVEKVIENMNVVLQQLVTGLTIGVKCIGTQLYPDGKPGRRIQLVSNKNNKEIPLLYESDGIKKLVSILQLLIAVYNSSSITVAIDELDSGVFEYLLGELLRIISETGEGQLIFTSHDLRPLEVLDKRFVAFTTTNSLNRYIRMSNIKTTNNLRDFYYRDIVLGEQCEPVYEMTNNSEIAMAFREAGG